VFLRRTEESLPPDSFHGSLFRFVVLVAGRPMGTIEAKIAPPSGSLQTEADISYDFFPEARGHGYAHRAINLINQFLRECDISRAVMRFDAKRRDYLKAPERCGFAELHTIDSPEGRMVLFARQL
jgi:RimJ/RimL family protein N-acetyltransferase